MTTRSMHVLCKTKTAAADKATMPRIPAELLEQLISGPVTPGPLEDIFQLFKEAFIERVLGAEMSHHLGFAPGQAKPHGAVNHRNGKSDKWFLTDTGALTIEVLRNRHGFFKPQPIGQHEQRFTGFDDKIIAMYARHDRARDPGLAGRDVFGGRLARSHQQRHRCRHVRGLGLAVAPAGAGVPGCVFQ